MYRAWVYDLYSVTWNNPIAWAKYLQLNEKLKFYKLLDSYYDYWATL